MRPDSKETRPRLVASRRSSSEPRRAGSRPTGELPAGARAQGARQRLHLPPKAATSSFSERSSDRLTGVARPVRRLLLRSETDLKRTGSIMAFDIEQIESQGGTQ